MKTGDQFQNENDDLAFFVQNFRAQLLIGELYTKDTSFENSFLSLSVKEVKQIYFVKPKFK